MEWLDRLFNQHKFVRRLAMIIVLGIDVALAVTAIVMILDDKALPAGWMPLLVEILALNAIYVGFYQWSRSRDNTQAIK